MPTLAALLASCGHLWVDSAEHEVRDAGPSSDAGVVCTAPSDAYPQIQNALDDPNCPTVVLLAGTFPGTFAIARPVLVLGDAEGTTLEGNGAGSVLRITGGHEVVLSTLRIAGGEAADGAGIHADAVLTLRDVVLEGHRGTGERARGSGLFLAAGQLTVSGASRIVGNTLEVSGTPGAALVAQGAGLFLAPGTSATVRDSTQISDNGIEVALEGGSAIALGVGVFLSEASLTLAEGQVEISRNLANVVSELGSNGVVVVAGGGIGCSSGAVTALDAPHQLVDNEVHARSFDVEVAAEGGGIALSDCDAELRSTQVLSNRARVTGGPLSRAAVLGGGLYSALSNVEAFGVTFENNAALATTGDAASSQALGGALYAAGGVGKLLKSTVSTNLSSLVADGDSEVAGAGIYVSALADGAADWRIEASTFDNNIAAAAGAPASLHCFGGALALSDRFGSASGSLDVLNTTLSANQASIATGDGETTFGGAVGVWRQEPTQLSMRLIHATLVANQVPTGAGGGVGVRNDNAPQPIVTVQNSLFWLNESSSPSSHDECVTFGSELSLVGGNLWRESSLCDLTGDGVGELIVGEDPLLSPLTSAGGETQVHTISVGSPAQDAALDAACVDLDGATLLVDQRGEARAAPCDLGAFELP